MPAININGTRLSFGATGSGSTVVALHSSASNGLQWTSLVDHLKNRHCVFTPDLSGHGRSEGWPGSGKASLANEAEFMFGMIKAWEEPVHLVGHSFGGAVALQIALANPDWVRSLTLIEPTVFHLLRDGNAADRKLHAQTEAVRGVLNASAALGNSSAGMQRLIDFWTGKDAWANTNPRLREHLTSQMGQVINNFAASDAETWPLRRCKQLTCPTMLMMGLESPAPSQRITEMLAETIPGAQLHMVRDAGHMLPMTDPHVVDPMVSQHIRDSEAEEIARTVIARLPQAA